MKPYQIPGHFQIVTHSHEVKTKLDEKSPSNTIARAFGILRTFQGGSVGLGVTDVSRKIGLHKSTISRLLLTLEQLGVVRRDPDTDKYWLGPEIIHLASEVPFDDYLIALAQPFLTELAQVTLEAVNFCLPEGDKVLHASQSQTSHYLVARRDWVGLTSPMHCASNGKVLLAFRSEAEIERYLAKPLERLTDKTITDPNKLREELATVRKKGYAVGLEELEVGLIGVSAPVFDRGGAAIASVNISGPAYRYPPEKRAEFCQLAVETARKITHRLNRRAID